jgi:hypothetical protein
MCFESERKTCAGPPTAVFDVAGEMLEVPLS